MFCWSVIKWVLCLAIPHFFQKFGKKRKNCLNACFADNHDEMMNYDPSM